jgi:hypothetical protein
MKILFLILTMTLAAARTQALKLWGPNYWLTPSFYTAQPTEAQGGIIAKGCQAEIIILGRGADYDGIFADFAAKPRYPVFGPYRGVVDLRTVTPAPISGATAQVLIDGNLALPLVLNGSLLDTSRLTSGMHAICSINTEPGGRVVRGEAMIFVVDPLSGQTAGMLTLPEPIVRVLRVGPRPTDLHVPVPDGSAQ